MKKKIIPVLIIVFIICIALIFKFSNKNEKDSKSNTDNPSSSDIEDSENDEPKVYEDPELDGYWINQDYELFQIYKKDDDYEVYQFDFRYAYEYTGDSLKDLITDEEYKLNENQEIYQVWEGDTLTYKITKEENEKYSISYLVGGDWLELDCTSIYKEEENLLLFYTSLSDATTKSKVEWNEDLGAYEGTFIFYYYEDENCILEDESTALVEVRPSVDDENYSPFYSIDPGW
jgi:hypothetical protein